MQVVVGDWAARDVAQAQPVKLAALEGLGEDRERRPVHLLGWYDGDGVEYGIRIPKLLSLLAYHDPNAKVQGLDSVPADERPPVNVVRFAFQTMVGIGTALAALGRRLPVASGGGAGGYRPRRGSTARSSPPGRSRSSRCIAGWVTTEVGRQPWVVYGVMRTEQAVTGASGIPVGYATLALVYAALVVAAVHGSCAAWRAPLDCPSRPGRRRPAEAAMIWLKFPSS